LRRGAQPLSINPLSKQINPGSRQKIGLERAGRGKEKQKRKEKILLLSSFTKEDERLVKKQIFVG
jgi:hypothetical protein